METKKRAKNHHYVPQFILRFFSADRYVFVYDREVKEFRRQNTNTITSISNYYSFRNKDGRLLADLEETMGKLENVAAPIIRKIVQGENTLNDQDRSELAVFLAAQLTRTPFAQKKAEALGEALFKLHIQATAYNDSSFKSMLKTIVSKSEDEVEDEEGLRQFMLNPDRYSIKFPREISLRLMMENMRGIGEAIFNMQWVIARCTDGKAFITSDNPFFSWQYKKPSHPMDAEALYSPTSITIFPLSPKVCLLLRYKNGSDYSVVAKDALVREINKATALYSRRFIISHSLDSLKRVVKRSGVDQIKPYSIGIKLNTPFNKKEIVVKENK